MTSAELATLGPVAKRYLDLQKALAAENGQQRPGEEPQGDHVHRQVPKVMLGEHGGEEGVEPAVAEGLSTDDKVPHHEGRALGMPQRKHADIGPQQHVERDVIERVPGPVAAVA